MLQTALIQVEEASRELQHHLDRGELDPERLHQVEERLDVIYQIARKHHCRGDELLDVQDRLQQELDGLQGGAGSIEGLSAELERLEKDYRKAADSLSK